MSAKLGASGRTSDFGPAALKLPAGISDNGPKGIPRRTGLAIRAGRSGATLCSGRRRRSCCWAVPVLARKSTGMKTLWTRSGVLRSALVAALAFSTLNAADVTADRLESAENEPENWLTYYGTYKSWRYSPLDQINRANVKRLTPVWAFESGLDDGGMQSAPLVVDGVMYVSTAQNHVFALDAVTGEQIWRYQHELPDELPTVYGNWNRGVAIAYGLVYLGTLDNHVVAIDAGTGREVWRVEVENSRQCGCNITSAPLVVKDMVITGVTGGDSAHRGYLNAFDARTGRHRWRFWTIPGPGEPGHETWKGDSWKYGGGSTWITGTYDPELDLVFWGVGNPAADFYGESRKGDNLYTESVVALDADTGKLEWYYQEIPYDVWDYDSAYELVLLELEVKGAQRKVIVNPNKSGYVWVLDRTNGEFLGAWPLVENSNWIERIDDAGNLVGRNEPPVGKPTLICPAIGGGRSWNHGAYSPETGWFYSTGLEWCQMLTVKPEEPREGMAFFGGEFQMTHPEGGTAHSHLGAYDPLTGKRYWQYTAQVPAAGVTVGDRGWAAVHGRRNGSLHCARYEDRRGAMGVPNGFRASRLGRDVRC